METMNNQRGRDVSAPITHITLNGTRYKLAFTNMAARVAEDVYAVSYTHLDVYKRQGLHDDSRPVDLRRGKRP